MQTATNKDANNKRIMTTTQAESDSNAIQSVTESTPLIKTVESGQSLEATQDEEVGVDTSNPTPNRNRRWRRTKRSRSSALPSWSQAFAEVSPFLRYVFITCLYSINMILSHAVCCFINIMYYFSSPQDYKHVWLAFLALLTVLLEKLITVLPPLAIRHAVDAISDYSSGSDGSQSMKEQTAYTVSMSIVVYFLLRTLDAAVSALQSVCQRAVSLDAERRFATSLFSHLQNLGAAYHLERHAGELLRILSRGSDATSTIIDSLWFNLIPTFFEAAVVGTVFWKLLGIPSIACTTVAAVILYLFYTVKVTNTRLEQRRKVLDRSEDVGRIETETLVNYETVVMFGREKKEVEEYDIVRKEYTQERVNMLGLFAWLQLGQQSIRLAGTCVGLWLAGRATVYGTGGGDNENLLSPGSFVVVQLYIQQLFQPLTVLGFTYRQLTEALTDLEKAVKMLRSKPLVEDEPGALEWDDVLEQQRLQSMETNSEDATAAKDKKFGLFRLGRHQRQKSESSIGIDAPDISSGDITFDNVSFRYKVKSQRKRLGGHEESAVGKKGGGRGFGRKGLWGGRGQAVWRGNGGANVWIKQAGENRESGAEESDEKVQIGGIENVSFNIPAGKTAALVGPSKHCCSC